MLGDAPLRAAYAAAWSAASIAWWLLERGSGRTSAVPAIALFLAVGMIRLAVQKERQEAPRVLALAACLATFVVAPGARPTMFACALVIFGGGHVERPEARSRVLYPVGLGLFACSIGFGAIKLLGSFTALSEWLSFHIDVALATSMESSRGPEYVGIPILCFALVLSWVVGAMHAEKPLRVRTRVVLVAVAIALFGARYAASKENPATIVDALSAATKWDYGSILASCVIGAWLAPNAVHLRNASGLQERLRGGRIVNALAVVVVTATVFPPMRVPSRVESTPRVLVLDEGGIDWKAPTHKTYEQFGGGMFGLLPEYARTSGITIARISRDQILRADLAGGNVLVLANTEAALDSELENKIEAFVRAGGCLLVLGDHTNVFGLMEALNPTLARFGVTFRYDSAYPAGGEWKRILEASVDWPRPSQGMTYVPVHGIGASLDIRWPVMPLLVGNAGFSDRGNPGNLAGAQLGNYGLDEGESIGGMVLACWRKVGRGRLVVYGDTSAFQNSSLPTTWRGHVEPLLRWACEETGVWDRTGARAVVAFVGVAFALLVAANRLRGSVLAKRVAVLGLAMTLMQQYTSSSQLAADIGEDKPRQRTVVAFPGNISPRIGHYKARWNDISAFYTNLHRANLVVDVGCSLTQAITQRSKAIVLVAPAAVLSPDEVSALTDYMSDGGTVLVCASYSDRKGVLPLLRSAGLEVTSVSLGPFGQDLPEWEYDGPKFRDAWAIDAKESIELTELCAHGDLTLAGHVGVGRGGLILIGDTRFLSGSNYERGNWYHAGTIKFLYALCEAYFGGSLRPPAEGELGGG